jgi:hypothetical protein
MRRGFLLQLCIARLQLRDALAQIRVLAAQRGLLFFEGLATIVKFSQKLQACILPRSDFQSDVVVAVALRCAGTLWPQPALGLRASSRKSTP